MAVSQTYNSNLYVLSNVNRELLSLAVDLELQKGDGNDKSRN